jgi:hypothetical protein
MRTPLAISLIALLALSAAGFGEEAPPPGKVKGTFTTDRWGRVIFSRNGTDVSFVSPAAAEALAKFAGQCVEINVGKWQQDMNPGGMMLDDVKSVEAITPSPDLVLKISPVSDKVEFGAGVTLKFSLENKSAKEQQLSVRRLLLCLATNKPVEPKGFRDPEGRAFWYHQEGMRKMSWAVRDLPLALDAGKMLADGKKIRRASREGDDNPILTVDAGGEYAVELTVARDLPVGEYEVFAVLPTKDAGVMSARAAFDVVEKK